MAGRLRQTTDIRTAIATTHGHEVWWARIPGARALLRRIGTEVDALTWLGASTRRPIEAALAPGTRTARLVPGVDTTAFRPSLDGSPVRARYGLGRRPVILCVARLVPADAFAMPCRTRRGGLEMEGLGIVYLEAARVRQATRVAPPTRYATARPAMSSTATRWRRRRTA